eukprot:6464007-Amphidinium_carterae.1
MEEQRGPPSFAEWRRSYRVLWTVLIQLDLYVDRLEKFHARCGADVWSLLYQADVRCRLENMARLYHQELHLVSLGKTSPGFNVDWPWDYVWRQAVLDAEFWREQFVEPAQLVRAHMQSLASTLGGDAQTTRTS